MSITNLINVLPFSHGRPSFKVGAGAVVLRWVEIFALWRERVRGRHDLMRLSEHQLRDIGLSPLDAETEWRKPFWRP